MFKLPILFPVVSLLVAPVSVWAQGYQIKSDPALNAPIKLSVKYGQLESVLKDISKQAGVPVQASGPITGTKLTIFVDNLPSGELLDRIACVLGGEWRNTNAGRMLAYSSATQNDMDRYLAAEDKFMRARAEQDLSSIIKRAEMEKEAAENRANTDATDSSTNEPNEAPPLPLRNRLGGLGMNRAVLADQIGKVLSDAGGGDLDEFWQGQYASVEMGPQSFPNVMLPGLRRRAPNRPSNDPSMVYARYDLYGSHLLQIGSSRFPVVPQRFEVPALLVPESELADTSFGKSILAWGKLDADPSDPVYGIAIEDKSIRRFGFGVADKNSNPAVPEDPVLETQSDLLEKLYKLSKVPIVADGFRTTLPGTTTDPTGKTVLEWLKSLNDRTGAFVRLEDGVIAVRQGGFWRLKQYEIPEAAIHTMEANSANLTLADYTTFYASLTPAQARGTQGANPPEVTFPIAQMADSVPALRLIGSLSSDFPTTGSPVAVQDLSSDSQQLVYQAIAESVFEGKLWTKTDPSLPAKAFAVVIRQGDIQQPQGMVPGTTLQIILPIGESVQYDIPIR
jgi:hypothetical protein